jgi:hypothetical protein
MWRRLAYAARYGNQPLAGLMAMTVSDLDRFNAALNGLLREEEAPATGSGDG